MRKIQVVLAVAPRMLREPLRMLLEGESDFQIADEVLDPVDLLMAVKDTEANVVIMTVPDAEAIPSICTHLLTEFPDLLVIAISSKANQAFTYRSRIDCKPLSGLMFEDVVTAIRSASTST